MTLPRFLALLTALAIAAGACARRQAAPDMLVIASERDVEGLDPHTAGQVLQTQTVLANVYEGLVTFDPQMSLVPALALSWTNPDELTWDFQIRGAVPFQSGGLLEGDDVVFSLQRARDNPRSVLRGALAHVTEIRALAHDRVRVVTSRADASLISRLRQVFIVSRRFMAANGEGALAARSAGTGPYRVASRREGETIDLTRFDEYWRGTPAIPKARFVARSFGEAALAAQVPPTGRLLFRLKPGTPAAQAGENVRYATPGLGVQYLSFDLRRRTSPRVRLRAGQSGNPFLDGRVREAVALVLDHPRLLREAAGEDGFTPTQLVPPDVFGFDPSIAAPRRNRDEARRLMASSDFAAGFDVELDLRPLNTAMAPALVRDLAELGILVSPNILPDKEFFGRLASGDSSLCILRFFCWTGDAQKILDDVFHSRDRSTGLGEFNFAYESNPVPGIDAEIEASRSASAPAVRLNLLQQAMRRVVVSRLAIPLLQDKDVTYAPPDLEWTPREDGFRLVFEARFKG
ncbi:MAG: ABC transporter substrate-binding protein [Thermoanaerobaculia bacterium]